MPDHDDWLANRVDYIRGLSRPSRQQQLLVALYDNDDRSAEDDKNMRALIKAEKAAERASIERARASRVVENDKKRARKERNRELYKSAGLMIMAGLVDTESGKPFWDKAELLGALSALAEASVTDEQRGNWKQRGSALLNKGKETRIDE